MMRRVLPLLVTLTMAALLLAPVMLASRPGQTPTIDVLSTARHDCVDMTFRPIRSGGHLYNFQFNVQDRCAGCRIDTASAKIVFDVNYCYYKAVFVAARNSERIRIRESDLTVVLKGTDERALRRLLALMCEEGGVPIPIGRPIKLEQEVDGIEVEFERGIPVRIEAPLPMSASVTASDTCGHRGFAIIPLSPGD